MAAAAADKVVFTDRAADKNVDRRHIPRFR